MNGFYGFLSLASLLAFCVGMVRPGMVIRMGKATRGRVALLFGISFVFFFGLFASTLEDVSPQADWKGDIAGKTEKELLGIYCSYKKENASLYEEAAKAFGNNPSDALQPGDELVIESSTPLTPKLPGETGETDITIEDVGKIKSVPAGTSIKIAARHIIDSRIWYAVIVSNGGEKGFINAVALGWYDTPERLDLHYKKKMDWLNPKTTALGKKYFVDNGIGPDFEMEASQKGWYPKCEL